jgi:hypothetical protein
MPTYSINRRIVTARDPIAPAGFPLCPGFQQYFMISRAFVASRGSDAAVSIVSLGLLALTRRCVDLFTDFFTLF